MAAKRYYAVKRGKSTGIFRTWEECRACVEGVPGAEYKGFAELEEAESYLGLEPGTGQAFMADLTGTEGKPGQGERLSAGTDWKPGEGERLSAGTDGKPGEGERLSAGTEGKPGEGERLSAGTDGKPGEDKKEPDRQEEKKQFSGQEGTDNKPEKRPPQPERTGTARGGQGFVRDGDEVPPAGTLLAYVDGSYDNSLRKYAFGCVFILPDGRVYTEYGNGDNEQSLQHRNVTGEMLGAMYAVRTAMISGFFRVELCYDYEGIEKWVTGAWRSKTELTKKYAAAMGEWRKGIEISFRKVAAHTNVYYNELADQTAKAGLRAGSGIPKVRRLD